MEQLLFSYIAYLKYKDKAEKIPRLTKLCRLKHKTTYLLSTKLFVGISSNLHAKNGKSANITMQEEPPEQMTNPYPI